MTPLGAQEQERELEELLVEHAERFALRFGRGAPARRFFSPGRVNLMGAHLDYNGGPVMPMALDRGTFVALRPRTDDRIELASTLERETLSTRLSDLPRAPAGRWFDYPLGVIVRLLGEQGQERSAIGADVLFGGNLPIGAGLSSSASICVGTAFAFRSLWGRAPDPMACIGAALWSEREWVGVQCGIMDPYAVALSRPGHVLWLECKDARYQHLPLDANELMVAIVDSGIRRELAKGDFNQRVAECREAFARLRPLAPEAQVLCDAPSSTVDLALERLGPLLTKRARHVTREVERTRAARAALLAGDHAELGRCISATHASLRDLYEVSVPELDCIAEAALGHPGVFGARLTGAGFGGCVVVLLQRKARAGLAEHLEGEFARRFGRTPPVFFFRSDAGPREFS
ncbi:MAG: galactokinase [Planctomycetes bacterium]|nr:galactokinase [Planctomycetota bacterium]